MLANFGWSCHFKTPNNILIGRVQRRFEGRFVIEIKLIVSRTKAWEWWLPQCSWPHARHCSDRNCLELPDIIALLECSCIFARCFLRSTVCRIFAVKRYVMYRRAYVTYWLRNSCLRVKDCLLCTSNLLYFCCQIVRHKFCKYCAVNCVKNTYDICANSVQIVIFMLVLFKLLQNFLWNECLVLSCSCS